MLLDCCLRHVGDLQNWIRRYILIATSSKVYWLWMNMKQSLWVASNEAGGYDYKISNTTCVVYWCNKRFPSFFLHDSIWIIRDGMIQTNRARVIHNHKKRTQPERKFSILSALSINICNHVDSILFLKDFEIKSAHFLKTVDKYYQHLTFQIQCC